MGLSVQTQRNRKTFKLWLDLHEPTTGLNPSTPRRLGKKASKKIQTSHITPFLKTKGMQILCINFQPLKEKYNKVKVLKPGETFVTPSSDKKGGKEKICKGEHRTLTCPDIYVGWTGVGAYIGFLSTFPHQETSGRGERNKIQWGLKTSVEVGGNLSFSLTSVRLAF